MTDLLAIKLHIMSPVHIGCDDVYEPTGFLVDEGTGYLRVFDAMTLIRSLTPPERERFNAICMQGTVASILQLYHFIAGRRIAGREIPAAKDFLAHYLQVKRLPIQDERRIKQELNKFEIRRTAYLPCDDLPYIPGSSLKGALRTAYLNTRAQYKKIADTRGNAKMLEEILLGGTFDTDPFRFVKVSDCMPAGKTKERICYAINKKKKVSRHEARGPFQILEVIDEGTVMEGALSVSEPEGRAIKEPIKARELLNSLNTFYYRILEAEENALEDIGIAAYVSSHINKKFNGQLGQSAFLVRLGRHSGAEAVTIEGHRSIRIMQGKEQPSQNLDHATTLWLASDTRNPITNIGLMPFGWAVMEVEKLDVKRGIYSERLVERPASREKGPGPVLPEPVQTSEPVQKPRPPVQTEYEGVTIVWRPGDRSINAIVDGKKAFADKVERSFIPDSLWRRLEQKKSAKATILIEPIGGNAFRIVRVVDET